MKLLRPITITLVLTLTLLCGTPGAFAMDSDNLVEQIQSIHRLSQTLSWDSLNGLLAAINSPVPLARRKASQGLLDLVKNTSYTTQDKNVLVQMVQPTLHHPDPVVQQNMQQVINTLEHAKTDNSSSSILVQPTVASRTPDGAMLSAMTPAQAAPIPESAVLLMAWSDHWPTDKSTQQSH